MPSGTLFAPNNSNEYGSKSLNADFKGIKFTAAVNSTTTNDLQLTDDCLIDGAVVIVVQGALGDKMNFQVIDKDNVLGYGANTVLGQYVTNWYVAPETDYQTEFKSIYPAKIYAGLYLRISYDATSILVAPTVLINYKLHKILW